MKVFDEGWKKRGAAVRWITSYLMLRGESAVPVAKRANERKDVLRLGVINVNELGGRK